MSWDKRAVIEFNVTAVDVNDLVALAAYDEPGEPYLLPLIDLFLATGPKAMQAIHHALTSGDLTVIHNSAHGLKSTSAQLGAQHFAELCLKLERETDPKHCTVKELNKKVPELLAAFKHVCRDLSVVRCLLAGESVPAVLKVAA